MTKKNQSTKYKHITDSERLQIEHMLKQGDSIRKIAKKVAKHHSTIAREIIARSVVSEKGAFGRVTNRCSKRYDCNKSQLCIDKPNCLKRCASCKNCNTLCADFQEEICKKLGVAPYVCNGCKDEHKCTLRKRYYLHASAHKNYRQILVSSREGANVSEWELLDINKVLTPLVKNGQSVHHAIANNTDRFYVHEKTIYRYIADGLLSVKDGDMPRICKIKPRKSKPVEHKVDTKCRIGRTYDDYNAFIATNPDVRVVQMDSVIGRIGGKVLLTLHWSDMHFMLAFLRERNDSKSVIDIFTKLRETLSLTLFSRLFSVLLTDNGSEFSNPCAIEGGSELNPQIRMFYCDPCASWQKGAAERNHEFIRMILPKATSFDDLSQSHINTVLSHVNSYSRPALNDRTPIDSFMFTFGTELLDKLAIHKIPANQIILKPSLLDS